MCHDNYLAYIGWPFILFFSGQSGLWRLVPGTGHRLKWVSRAWGTFWWGCEAEWCPRKAAEQALWLHSLPACHSMPLHLRLSLQWGADLGGRDEERRRGDYLSLTRTGVHLKHIVILSYFNKINTITNLDSMFYITSPQPNGMVNNSCARKGAYMFIPGWETGVKQDLGAQLLSY